MESAFRHAFSRNSFVLYLPMGIATLLPTFGMSIANVALPTFTVTFSQSLANVQWVVSAYLFALTVFSLLAGRVADRVGARSTLILGYLVFIAGSVACYFAANLTILIAGRVVQGTGAAALAVVAISLAKSIGGEEKLGRVMGTMATLTAVGTALGPSVGGIVLELFGWRTLFLHLVAGTVFGLLSTGFVPAQSSRQKKTDKGLVSHNSGSLVEYAAPAIANCFVSVIMMTTFIAGPFFLTYALGFSEGGVGIVMAIGPVISVLAGVPSGFLVDRFGPQRVMAVGLSQLVIGALCFAFLPNIWGIGGYVVALIVMTPGYQMFLAANNTSVMRGVPDHRRGVVSGLLNMSRNAGLILGASAIAALFMWGAGTPDLRSAGVSQIGDAFRLVFLVNVALISASGLMLFSARTDR